MAYFLMTHLARKIGGDFDLRNFQNLYVVCYIAGWFGARSFSIINDEKITEFSAFLIKLFDFGPMTFYGGFILAVGAGYAFCKYKQLNVYDFADVGIVAGLLALSVGRVGCFLNGDDYGLVIESSNWKWIGVSFPNLGDIEAGRLRWPVQLFEAASVVLGVLFFTKNFVRIRQHFFLGAVSLFIAIYYCLIRFFLEMLRGDPRGNIGSLSMSQFISLIIFCAALVLYLKRRSNLVGKS